MAIRTQVDHCLRAGRLWPVLIDSAARKSTLTYGQAASMIGIHHRAMAFALAPLQDHCIQEGLPPLTALVVNASTGRQGNGYVAGEPGNDRDIADIFEFNWASIANPFGSMPESELDELASILVDDPSSVTDVYARVLTRGDAQRLFRKSVISAYGGKCSVCGLGFFEALEAAHIVPWSRGKPEQRIDPRNGILFCSNHHRLFDADWLEIDEEYNIMFHDPELQYGPYSRADRSAAVELHGSKINLPSDEKLHPNRDFIRQRRKGSFC